MAQFMFRMSRYFRTPNSLFYTSPKLPEQNTAPCKHVKLNQCCLNVGSTSTRWPRIKIELLQCLVFAVRSPDHQCAWYK